MIRMADDRVGQQRSTPPESGERSAAGRERVLLAELCRTWGRQLLGSDSNSIPRPSAKYLPQNASSASAPPISGMSMGRRHKQTLELLLAGDAEKQIAGKLGLSRHTIHDYVKAIYRRFGVNSRGELLALWVQK